MERDLTQLLEGTDFVGPEGVTVTGFTSDSRDVRDVRDGFVFIAVPGFRTDGHEYIPQAIDRGAAAIVLENMTDTQGVPTYQVPSSRRALSRIAAAWFDFPASQMKIIGITGTNGKTTITNILRTIFTTAGMNAASIGTLGYTIGEQFYPTTLTTPDAPELHERLAEMVEADTEIVAMEISSHALALERVVDIPVETAVFTNLGEDHYEFHNTREAYRAAKGNLFSRLPDSGHAVLNYDSPEYVWFVENCGGSVHSYSLQSQDADYYYRDYTADFTGGQGTVQTPYNEFEISTRLLGRYNLSNILAAIAVAEIHGVDISSIGEGVGSISHVAGRLELVETGDEFPRVYVDYAHTPDALESTLTEVVYLKNSTPEPAQVIVVFGCGGNRDKAKRPKMGAIAEKLADRVIVTSDNPRDENPLDIIEDIQSGMAREDTIIEPDREKAIYKALALSTPNDFVLIAGKGHEDYQIIGDDRIDFDDKVVVQQAIEDLQTP
ncbi:MAG: UDP-N-acetylmuramoyl-L-alanyl-D-glutamate--2,6-diaminopimelate ligase [Candidatus Marinimicrobia bacterium]|nr:UDP-N-acetylmuramoyl-L-alanyl-D-glutamate--2,6-diaminopimelate ligase [Candidatus Neomarinimicrobiota bacterium]